MSADIYLESMHIGYAVLWGLKLAFIYDIISIFRNTFVHKNFFIYAEDFLYWIFSALFVFGRLYEIGNGQMRWYMALGIGIGMIFYKLTVSRFLVKGASYVTCKLAWGLGKIIYFMLKPFRYIIKIIKKSYRFLGKRLKSIFRLMKKKLTLTLKLIKITLCKR